MTALAGSGTNQLNDAYQAGFAAAAQACEPLGGRQPTLVLAFTTDQYDQAEVVRGIRAATDGAALLGCCTGGIISAEGPSSSGVSVLALWSDAMEVTLAIEGGIQADPTAVAEAIAERIEPALPGAAGAANTVAIMLADGLTGSLTEVVKQASNTLGPLCPLVGGGAGDNLKFLGTSQFVNDEVRSDAIAMALITSAAPVGIGVQHGWQPAGRALVVTRSEGNVVHEFDGRPAFTAYRELFPEAGLTEESFSAFVIDHPIGLPQVSGEYLIRDPLRVRPDGAIECVASVPENAVAHIMHGDPETLFAAAAAATKRALAGLGGGEPAAVVVFDCVSRLLMLGQDAATEIKVIRDVVGHDTPITGMFSFGEIAAAETGGTLLHNKTVVVYAIGR
ncbi:MAG TPA: FIST N-terminal domain-containing protein [Herpetosiphonaceae bacterium]